MDCLEIERALLNGDRVDPATAHLRECESCRFLVEEGAVVAHALAGGDKGGAAVALDLAGLEQAVAGRLERERGPLAWLRALSRGGRFGLLVAIALAEAAYFFATHRRGDWELYPAWRMGIILAVMAGVLAGAMWHALRPLYQPPSSPWLARGLLAAGLLVPVLVALAPELPTVAGSYRGHPSDLVCLANGVLLALLVFGAFFAVARDVRHLVLGAIAAAATALVVLQIECPFNYQAHLLLGHATIPPVLLLVAAALRRVRYHGA